MSKQASNKRPKKKGPAPRQAEQPKKSLSKQQIVLYTIGILVIASMAFGILASTMM
jgi:cell division protein FtsL